MIILCVEISFYTYQGSWGGGSGSGGGSPSFAVLLFYI